MKENGRSRLAVIKGPAGTGKTRLLKDFRTYLAQHRIRYISTNFSRHENNLPLNALANGFNEYLFHVYNSQGHEAEEIKRKVRALLGPTASLVARIVQGLKPYLDLDMEQENLRSGLEQEREFDFNDFAKAFSDFTRCLASESEPIAFFFDDMQWVDDKSLELIDRFFSYNNSQRFFLIIGHRPLGLDEGVNFQCFLTKFSRLRRRYSEIELGTLLPADIAKLNRSILNLQHNMDPEFLDYITQKSGSNPLYLLELHRSLVTQELLSLDDQGNWRFDLSEMRKAEIQSNSIDLTLNRLVDLDSTDRRVLDVAAILGTHFSSDMLRILHDVDDATLAQTLSSALLNGLLVRGQTPSGGFSSLAFTFTHRSIREVIIDMIPLVRRQELHRLVARELERGPAEDRAQTIFTLAHHYFHALPAELDSDQILIEKAIVYNIRAGAKAMEVDSLLTAQRYYTNARVLLPHWRSKVSIVRRAQRDILHSLADILFAQRNFVEASRTYNELKLLRLNQMEYSQVTYKLLHLSLVSGQAAATLLELVRAFQALRFPVIRLDAVRYLKAAWVMFKAVIVPIKYSLPMGILQRADQVEKKNEGQSFHPFLLYFMGQSAGFNYDKRLGLIYHTALLQRCAKLSLPEDLALRLLCDHALILGYLGFQQRAYRLLDVIHERAYQQGWHTIIAYLSFIQTLIIDQYQGKFEDPRDGLEIMQQGLEDPDFILPAMQEKICRIFLGVVKGKAADLTRIIQSLPGLFTIRHWLTPRAVSMYLFWLLLTDSRDLIVSYRRFVDKRSAASNRRGDTFLKIIESIVSLAAGDKDKARRSYYQALAMFRDRLRDPFLLPFEVDFVLLFMMFFPEAFAFEYGDQMLLNAAAQPSLSRLQSLAEEPRHRRRAIPMLTVARLQETFGGKDTKRSYDIALKRAKIMQQPVVELLTELWFGRHLFQQRAIVRVDYVQKATEKARQLGLDLVVAMAHKTASDLGRLSIDAMTNHGRMDEGILRESSDPFLQKHMLLLPTLTPERMSFDAAKKEVFALLSDRLVFAEVNLITCHDILAFNALGQPPGDGLQQMIAYITPYINLRSSLTIPVGDAPWMQNEILSSQQNLRRTKIPVAATKLDLVEDVESTMVLSQGDKLLAVDAPVIADSVINDRLTQRSMNTLVPIRYGQYGLGVFFMEHSRLQDEDSTLLRQLLDSFGAQVGIWLRAYLGGEPLEVGLPLLYYDSGSYHLETCSWLHIWTEGDLRSARESVWYLGLNLSVDNYLMVYCRLNGAEDMRSPLSAILWHEMLVLRTLFSGAGSDNISEGDVQEAVERQLRGYSVTSNLEGLALSFSILHRQSGEVSSGHFGMARPMVIGQSNDVTPQNRVVLNLSNGRYLRYWKVYANFLQKGTYILTHDSSKLDRLNYAELKEQNFEGLGWEQKRRIFREYLKKNLIEGHVPRYFVAVSRNSTATASKSHLEQVG